jgi:hypothetical protein
MDEQTCYLESHKEVMALAMAMVMGGATYTSLVWHFRCQAVKKFPLTLIFNEGQFGPVE